MPEVIIIHIWSRFELLYLPAGKKFAVYLLLAVLTRLDRILEILVSPEVIRLSLESQSCAPLARFCVIIYTSRTARVGCYQPVASDSAYLRSAYQTYLLAHFLCGISLRAASTHTDTSIRQTVGCFVGNISAITKALPEWYCPPSARSALVGTIKNHNFSIPFTNDICFGRLSSFCSHNVHYVALFRRKKEKNA